MGDGEVRECEEGSEVGSTVRRWESEVVGVDLFTDDIRVVMGESIGGREVEGMEGKRAGTEVTEDSVVIDE